MRFAYPLTSGRIEICLRSMTKAPTPTEKIKKKCDNTKTQPKTSITQRLRTNVGRSLEVPTATQLCVVKQVYGIQTFPLTAKVV